MITISSKIGGKLLPLVVFGIWGYSAYVYSYRLCWLVIIQHRKKRAIGILFLVLSSVICLLILCLWTLIIFKGPGKMSRITLDNGLGGPAGLQATGSLENKEVPEPCAPLDEQRRFLSSHYPCDFQGHPLYCSSCQSLKQPRSHHSSAAGHCVPRMDHYCMWLGAVIGQNNYRWFYQIIVWFTSLFLFIIVTTAIYAKNSDINNTENTLTSVYSQFIALLIITGALFIALIHFVVAQTRFIIANVTTIENLNHIRGETEYWAINTEGIWSQSATRYIIVQINHKDPNMAGMRWLWGSRKPSSGEPSSFRKNKHRPLPRPYDLGAWPNIKLILGYTPVHWLLPLPYTQSSYHNISELFVDALIEKYETDIQALNNVV